MHLARQVGQGEIRRLEGLKHPPALPRRLPDAPRMVCGVGNDRLAEQAGECHEIVGLARDELCGARGRYCYADLSLAETLRLERPSADPLQVGSTQPQSVTAIVGRNPPRGLFATDDVSR